MNNSLQFLDKKIELSNDKIHVFLLNLEEFNYKEFLFCLSEEESERAARLKVEEKKKQFVVTRAVLRKLLSKSLSKVEEEIVFLYGQHKKPYIENKLNNKSVEFNISHSGEYALIAITLDRKVGVDIEKINNDVDYQSLSKRFFSEKENKELDKTDKEKKLDAFYRAWVRKESFIKAIGKGIVFGLDNFSVSLGDNKKNKVNIVSKDIDSEQWYCYDLMEVINYKTALTSCNESAEIIFYQ